jgi:hypothetical protein
MSNSSFTQGTLPIIRNASRLYRRMASMSVGEVIEVFPHQLPRSYRTIGQLIGRFRRERSLYFVAREFDDKPGWKVTRVADLVTLKTFSILPLKSKHMNENMPARIYNFSDAKLVQIVDAKIISATRDLTDLTPRGVTAARLEALETANEAFKILPTDEWWEGQLSLAVEARNTSRNLLESKLGNVRTMAQNVWGDKSVKYGTYKFEGMLALEDAKLVSRARGIFQQATLDAADLLAEGCTPAFLTALDELIKDFDDKQDLVRQTESDRHNAVEARVNAGNAIYTEVDKICNTGKDVYRETDPAKYDDYIIYNTPSGSSGNTAVREADVAFGADLDVDISDLEGTDESTITLEISGTNLKFFSATTPGGTNGASIYEASVGSVTILLSEFATLTGIDETRPFLTVRNSGVVPGHYKLTFTNMV